MKKYPFLYRNGLSIAFLVLFTASFCGQVYTGLVEHNKFLADHHSAAETLGRYLASGHFIEATFENWESEFLQMGLFVVMTIFLRQQGSSESKKCDEPFFDHSELAAKEKSAWPVKRGGFYLAIYKHSLSIALFALFIFSFLLHWYGSWLSFNEQQSLEHKPVQGIMPYLWGSKLWFESFQNWQSEFLSIFAIIVLSIYLRQYGSSQSKAVNAANEETGE